ncbi:MAG TPA: helix-turn-helix transcriptional regulator [Pyrinomonadaceae bacterium]
MVRPAKRAPKTKWGTDFAEPRTYGDHVRARRLALGLFRKEAAKLIGVDTTTVYNWESGRVETGARHVPGVTRFLGYCPYETGLHAAGWLKLVRQSLGLSQEMIADAVGVDEGTWQRWEAGRSWPPEKHLELIRALPNTGKY